MLRSGPAQAWLAACAELLPDDPARANGDAQPAEQEQLTQEVVAEAEDDRGGRAVARLRTPEAYAFTPIAAAAVIERVLAGDVEAGFQTPARVYGSELVMTLSGVTREDLQ
jgi:short subunit dehydrogenase-like uncharacterized protein